MLHTLEGECFVTKNHDDSWNITHLGALLFGRNFRQFKTLKRKAVRVILYIASRIIADTIEAGFIKASDPLSNSKRHATYIPFWA